VARKLSPPDVILFEGILLLYPREILPLLSMKLFVDVDSDERLARRGLSDVSAFVPYIEGVYC